MSFNDKFEEYRDVPTNPPMPENERAQDRAAIIVLSFVAVLGIAYAAYMHYEINDLHQRVVAYGFPLAPSVSYSGEGTVYTGPGALSPGAGMESRVTQSPDDVGAPAGGVGGPEEVIDDTPNTRNMENDGRFLNEP